MTMSPDQAVAARSIMANATPRTAARPLQLLPAEGIRWSDMSRAVQSAGSAKTAVVRFAVVDEEVGRDRSEFHLKTIEGYPAIVIATRSSEGVVVEAITGPYPDIEPAQQASTHIQAAVLKSLRAWGLKPELP